VSLRPLGDNVIVKRTTVEEKTPGGIFIPEAARETANRGEVVAVGRGRLLDNGRLIEPSVKPGDIVLFGKYTGSDIEVGGDKLLVVKESEIFGVIEGGST
jgi:chaperonin GroES